MEKMYLLNKIIYSLLVFLIFLLPWEIDFRNIGINIPFVNTDLEIVIFILVILWFIYKFYKKDYYSFKKSYFYFVLIFFVLWHFISTLFANKYIFWSFKFSLKILGATIIYFIFTEIVNSQDRIKKIFLAIFISAGIISILGILEHFFPSKMQKIFSFFTPFLIYLPDNTVRIKSTFVHPNVFAMYIEIVTLLACGYMMILKSKKNKFIMMCLVSLLTVSMVFTYSRGGILGFFGGLISFWFLCFVNKSMKKHLIKFEKILLCISIIFLIAILIDSVFFVRLKNAFNVEDNPIRERLYLWLTASHIFMDAPIFGVGPDAFQLIYKEKYFLPFKTSVGVVTQTDNFYLEMFTNLGIIGGFIFILLVIKIFRINIYKLKLFDYLIEKRNELKNFKCIFLQAGVLCMFVCFFVHGFVDYFLRQQSILLFFWIGLGLSENIKV